MEKQESTSGFERTHKEKPKQFQSVTGGTTRRLEESIKKRRSGRLTIFDLKRDLQSPTPKSKPEPVSEYQLKVDLRKQKLQKWKEEKEEKKRQAAASKKKPFLLGASSAPFKEFPPISTSGMVTRSQTRKAAQQTYNNGTLQQTTGKNTLQPSTSGKVTRSQTRKAAQQTYNNSTLQQTTGRNTLQPSTSEPSTSGMVTRSQTRKAAQQTYNNSTLQQTTGRNKLHTTGRNTLQQAAGRNKTQMSSSVNQNEMIKSFAPKNSGFRAPTGVQAISFVRNTRSRPLPTKQQATEFKVKQNTCAANSNVMESSAEENPEVEIIKNMPLQFSSDCPEQNGNDAINMINNKAEVPKSESKSEENLRSPKSPVDLPLTPQKMETVAQSPCVTLSRGKNNARNEMKWKLAEGILNPNECCAAEDVDHFRQRHAAEIARITEICDTWDNIYKQNVLPDAAQGAVFAAVAQARLLMSGKMVQFKTFVEKCAHPEPGDILVYSADLAGLWDTVYMQVNNIDLRFEELEELRARGWVEMEPPVEAKKKAATKPTAAKKPAATSRLRDVIAAKKRAMKEQASGGSESAAVEAASAAEKTFDEGFFSVRSPVRSSLSPGAAPRTPAARSLLKAVLSDEATKASTFKVNNIDLRFEELEELRARGWVEMEPPVEAKKKAATKPTAAKKPAATSRLRDVIAAKKRAMKEQASGGSESAAVEAASAAEKTFDEGFFSVRSPVRSSLSPGAAPRTPAARSLLKAVLSDEATKASTFKVNNIDLRFEELEELRARGWVEMEPPVEAKKKAATKPTAAKKPAATSRLRDVIAAKKRAMKEQASGGSESAAVEAASAAEKTFDEGFFSVRSPVRSSLSPGAAPRTPAARSLLKAVLSDEATKASTFKVNNIDLRFEELEELRARGWVEMEPPVEAKKKAATKPTAAKKPAATSRLRDVIAAKKRAMKEQASGGSESAAVEAASAAEKTFDEGFFSVRSPVRSSLSPGAAPRTPAARSLLKAVLSDEATKASTFKGNTPFAILRASMLAKNVQIDGIAPLPRTPTVTPINLNATPGSILKSANQHSGVKSAKVVLFQQSELDSDDDSPSSAEEHKQH